MRLKTLILTGTAILAIPPFPAPTLAAPAEQPVGTCTLEAVQPVLAANVHIESIGLDRTADTQSSYCHVSGHIDDGSHISFELGLPTRWNGKFLFIGTGGFSGAAASIDAGVLRGYATASTDTGHKGSSPLDAAWALNNRPAIVNHYKRGVPLAVTVSKNVTAAYYAQKPTYSYFDGCSGGGRQGLVEAQDFPDQFDGIIAGAPAWNYTKLFATFVANSNYLASHPAGWIAPGKFAAIDAEVLRQCDAADGMTDGMVADPRQCRPDLKKMLCRAGAAGADCLTGDQVAALEYFSRARSAAETKAGWASYPLTGSDSDLNGFGMPTWTFGPTPLVRNADGRYDFAASGSYQKNLGSMFMRYIVRNDPDYDYRTFRTEQEIEKLQSRTAPLTDADQTDLGPFVRRGGKLLLWHGWSDQAIPAEMSIDLYNRIQRDTRDTGGQPLDRSVRLFMVPGLQHCSWGSGLTEFDRIGALERWVEQGEAPDQLRGEQVERGAVKRSRPICAFPNIARFRGTGDPADAANFACVSPKG